MNARSLPAMFATSLVAISLGSPAADLPPAGTVLSESSNDLGFGFREVHRSKVNQPGHFEAVGHFGYVYHRDELLCQCSRTEIAISPDGRYSIFVNSEDGKLTLYQSNTHSRRALSQKYIGAPVRAVWKQAEVILTLVRCENGKEHESTLSVSL